MVNFFNFLSFFPLFISNTSIVRINFRANLDAQNAGNDIFKNFLGEYTHRPPIHAWYIRHTRGFQPLLSPSNILSHRKVPFQKMPPPHGKILKKGPGSRRLLRKEKLAWESVEKHGKKRLLKRKVSKGLSSQRYVPMIL